MRVAAHSKHASAQRTHCFTPRAESAVERRAELQGGFLAERTGVKPSVPDAHFALWCLCPW